MACRSRKAANTFNFLRWDRITNGGTSDLPIKDLCPIDLTGSQPTIQSYYYGTASSNAVLNEAAILAGTEVPNSAAGAITIPWSGVGVHLWFWTPGGIAAKIKWSDPSQPLNAGNIGQTNDLFNAAASVTVNSISGNFFITDLATFGRPLTVS